MHQYPLHRISYCADDKGEKKFFSFIAKEEDAEKHTCFVFVSDKLAEEITLTIGQAFDLAYRRFLETSGKDLETQRRCMVLQQKIKRLEHENNVYRQRLQDIAAIKGSVSMPIDIILFIYLFFKLYLNIKEFFLNPIKHNYRLTYLCRGHLSFFFLYI